MVTMAKKLVVSACDKQLIYQQLLASGNGISGFMICHTAAEEFILSNTEDKATVLLHSFISVSALQWPSYQNIFSSHMAP